MSDDNALDPKPPERLSIYRRMAARLRLHAHAELGDPKTVVINGVVLCSRARALWDVAEVLDDMADELEGKK